MINRVRGLSILVTIGLIGVATGEADQAVPPKTVDLPGLVYRKGDAGDAIQCQGGEVPKNCGSISVLGAQTFTDCSTQQYECLFNEADVLAIPKKALSLGQKYTVFGATLTVERCFAAGQTPCAIALIRSECAGPKDCECRSPFPGRKALFYFSPDLGVLSYYAINDPTTIGFDSKWIADSLPMVTYNLVAEKGFFRTPLALPKATKVGTCKKH